MYKCCSLRCDSRHGKCTLSTQSVGSPYRCAPRACARHSACAPSAPDFLLHARNVNRRHAARAGKQRTWRTVDRIDVLIKAIACTAHSACFRCTNKLPLLYTTCLRGLCAWFASPITLLLSPCYFKTASLWLHVNSGLITDTFVRPFPRDLWHRKWWQLSTGPACHVWQRSTLSRDACCIYTYLTTFHSVVFLPVHDLLHSWVGPHPFIHSYFGVSL